MTTVATQLRDWYIKGHQLSRCYIEDWEYIRDVFRRIGLDLNTHGPIITINERKTVREAELITEKIAYWPEFTQYRKKDIFATVLRAEPIYTRIHANDGFIHDICNTRLLHELIPIQGTIKDTDSVFESVIQKAYKNEKPKHSD